MRSSYSILLVKQITVTGVLGELGAIAARIVTKENITERENVSLNHITVQLPESPARDTVDMRSPAT